MRNFIAGLAAGALALCAGYALASRNSSGTMSSVNGPYVPGTTISSSQINARFADIERELTDSLSRSGKGGMTASLKEADGTVSSPSFTFNNEPVSGLYRIGANDLGLSVNGALKHEWTGTGETVTGTQTVTGAGTFGGSLGIGGLFTETISGSSSIVASTIFEPALSNGNFLQLSLGRTTGVNDYGAIGFIPNASSALSAVCLAVNGAGPSSLCVDGNQKTTMAGALSVAGTAAVIGAATLTGALAANGGTTTTTLSTSSTVKFGAAGASFSQMTIGNCTLVSDGTSPSICTGTVLSGSQCSVSVNGDPSVTTPPAVSWVVSGTTLTVGTVNPIATGVVVNWICFG